MSEYDASHGDGLGPRLGSWVRAGELVGIVAKVGDGQVTLFDPADRRQADVPVTEVQAVPAGAVTVTATVDLPLAHGLDETAVRRWVAILLDATLRERAYAALASAGLDEGASLPEARLDVRASQRSGAVCLCGARTPAPAGTAVACSACGRQAVSAPAERGQAGTGP